MTRDEVAAIVDWSLHRWRGSLDGRDPDAHEVLQLRDALAHALPVTFDVSVDCSDGVARVHIRPGDHVFVEV